MAKKTSPRHQLKIGGNKIELGERKKIYLDVAALYDYTKLNIPIEVIRGKKTGPTLFISAAIHGDEINGIEIIKKLLRNKRLNHIKGTLIAIPVVNVFGFNNRTRYLPDRRDLNRHFPGSASGSLAGRIAHIFTKEVVSKCTHGIDLHTAAIHRSNYPQIRAFTEDKETLDLAKAFKAPVVIHSKLRDGSLRESARKRKVKTLLFEGGEALRFEEDVIKVGLKGCLSVMEKIGMLEKTSESKRSSNKVRFAKDSYWLRAPHSGSFRFNKKLGDSVEEGDVLAVISDLFGDNEFEVKAEERGIIIGCSTTPLVNRGDAMFHIAVFAKTKKATYLDIDS